MRLSLIIGLVLGLIHVGPLAWCAADRIVVSRFAGFERGKDAAMAFYLKNAKGWKPHSSFIAGSSVVFHQKTPMPSGGCLSAEFASLFQQGQAFAMDKYISTGYLTRDEAREYLLNSINFTDRPVSFYHYLTDLPPPAGLQSLLGEDMSLIFGNTLDDALRVPEIPEKGYVHASLFTVAGQKVVPNPQGPPLPVVLDLPWTKDPEFAEAARIKFDRKKFPLAWEIGRAASTDPHEFSPLLSFAGHGILQEVMHYAAPNAALVQKAYVTFHALNAENTAKFSKLFPDRIFLRAKSSQDNVVFLVPLSEYLAKFRPEKTLTSYRIFHEAAGSDKRSAAEILAFAEAAKFVQHMPLDFRYRGQLTGKPLFLNAAFSGTSGVPMEQLASKFGIDETLLDKLLENEFHKSFSVLGDPLWPGLVVDPALMPSIPGAKEARAFQISNLDPDLAKGNPDYVQAALLAAFDHYVSQYIGSALRQPEGVRQMAQWIKDEKLRFMITTQFPSTAEAISRLGPGSRMSFDLSNEKFSRIYWKELTERNGATRPSLRQEAFIFSIDHIMALRNEELRRLGMRQDLFPQAGAGYFWWLHGAANP